MCTLRNERDKLKRIPLTISPLQIEHGQIVVISSVFTIRRPSDIYLIHRVDGRVGGSFGAYSFVTSIPDIYWLHRKFNGRFHRATSTESTRALRARLRCVTASTFCRTYLQSGGLSKIFTDRFFTLADFLLLQILLQNTLPCPSIRFL